MKRDWIVVSGSLVDTTKGGGFEFFGPFTEEEADTVKKHLSRDHITTEHSVVAIHLIGTFHRTLLKENHST